MIDSTLLHAWTLRPNLTAPCVLALLGSRPPKPHSSAESII